MEVLLGIDEKTLYVIPEGNGPIQVLRENEPPAMQWHVPETAVKLQGPDEARRQIQAELASELEHVWESSRTEAFNDLRLALRSAGLTRKALSTIEELLDLRAYG